MIIPSTSQSSSIPITNTILTLANKPCDHSNMTTLSKSTSAGPASPSASFYDMSDDEEGEYNTVRHAKTGKGVKLLYTKSKVGYLSHTWTVADV